MSALQHVLGLIQYYYLTVPTDKQLLQREHISKLSELDRPRVDFSKSWTMEHTNAMRSAMDNICNGDWLLVYDTEKPVYMTVDASSLLGDHSV